MLFRICRITGIFLVMVVFGVESMTIEECQKGLKRETDAVETAVKAGDRTKYRTHCPLFGEVISTCEVHMSPLEVSLVRQAHKIACDSDESRKWLASRGTSLYTGSYGLALVFLFSILGCVQVL